MSIKVILIWALLLRFLVMPFFFHPDLKEIHLRVSYLYTANVINIYDYLKQDPFTKINAPDFAYPPITYFTLGTYQFLISPLLGNNFLKWVYDYSDYRYNSPDIFRYLFSLKLIYLFFELLTGLLIYKFLSNPKERNLALMFWFFNPINLYAVYAIGQFDIIPTFFTFLSFYLWNRQKALLAGISLSVGIAFKSFPLLLLPLFWISKSSNELLRSKLRSIPSGKFFCEPFIPAASCEVFWFKNKSKIIFSVSALLFYFLTIIPYLSSIEFQKDVLFSGLSTRIFELKISLGSIDVSMFLLLYSIFLLLAFVKKKTSMSKNILISLLLVFSVTRFHPQWIIWLMPFLTLVLARGFLSLKYVIPLFISYFLYFIFYGDSFLTTGLLSPMSILFLEIPPFTQLVPQNYSHLIRPVTQIFFAFTALLIILKLTRVKKDQTQ